jgi:hypothetical protein
MRSGKGNPMLGQGNCMSLFLQIISGILLA